MRGIIMKFYGVNWGLRIAIVAIVAWGFWVVFKLVPRQKQNFLFLLWELVRQVDADSLILTLLILVACDALIHACFFWSSTQLHPGSHCPTCGQELPRGRRY